MRDLFIGWIIIQLILIGSAGAIIYSDIVTDTYECGPGQETMSTWIGAAVPLMFFIPEQTMITEYCNNK